MTYHVATEKWAWLRGSSPLAMLGMEACCCNNSSFRSHNHESLRFLKLFLLHKDGGKKKSWRTLLWTFCWLLVCSATAHTLKKTLKCREFYFHQLYTSNAILSQSRMKRNGKPKASFGQSKGSPLPRPKIFRYLRGHYFNVFCMRFPLSANLKLRTKQ